MTKLSELENLSATARDLFHFINGYSELHNFRDKITVHFVVDQFQSTETDTCGIFQLFLYELFFFNLFVPSEQSTIKNDTKLTINKIRKLLNE